MSAHAFLVEKVNQTSRTDLSGKSLCCIFGSPCRRRRNRGGHKVSLRDPKKGCSLLASWVVSALASKQGRDVNDRHPPPLFWSHFNVQVFIIHLAYSSILKFSVVRLSWASRLISILLRYFSLICIIGHLLLPSLWWGQH